MVFNNIVHGKKRRWAKYQIVQFSYDRRNRLKHLRENDYKQFEWLLERLDLFYKPQPIGENEIMIARKEGLRQLTQVHCDAVRQTKLNEYRATLEDEQLPFLAQKLKNLAFIRSEEIELGLQQTVTQEQIDRIQKQHDELKVKVDAKAVAPSKKKWKIY